MKFKRIFNIASRNIKFTVKSAFLATFAALSGVIAIFLLSSAIKFNAQSQDIRIKAAAALIREAASNCYVLEGRYPDDIDYLVKNYGIIIEREKYVYTYRIEQNRPYIEVSRR